MDFFVDESLRARQTQLNAQWNGLWGTYNSTCENGLGNAFPEFATDYNGWNDFYNSGSDWSSASKHATDQWQAKAQEWSKRLKDYGCGDATRTDLGIPGVKDPPPDEPGLIDKALDAAGSAAKWTIGGTVGLIALLLAGAIVAIYFLSKSSVSVSGA